MNILQKVFFIDGESIKTGYVVSIKPLTIFEINLIRKSDGITTLENKFYNVKPEHAFNLEEEAKVFICH